MCSHPVIRTSFYELAERKGWKVLPGTETMIHQCIAQQFLWAEVLAEDFDVNKAKEVIRAKIA